MTGTNRTDFRAIDERKRLREIGAVFLLIVASGLTVVNCLRVHQFGDGDGVGGVCGVPTLVVVGCCMSARYARPNAECGVPAATTTACTA